MALLVGCDSTRQSDPWATAPMGTQPEWIGYGSKSPIKVYLYLRKSFLPYGVNHEHKNIFVCTVAIINKRLLHIFSISPWQIIYILCDRLRYSFATLVLKS